MQESPARILTIDDDHTVRENIAAYLEDSGFIVYEAENGAVGLDVFAQHTPDLVLVDLRMPVMEGTEVVKRLKASHPDTPVIVVSGVGVLEEAVEALRLGAWDFVTKPISDMMVLEHAINKALERAAFLDERKRYHENLEREVAQRTRELRETNERLMEYQAMLQDKNQFLETLIESIPNPVFYKDLQGNYLGCNRIFSSIMGVEQKDVVGMSAKDLLPDELACEVSRVSHGEPGAPALESCELTLTSPQNTHHHLVLYKSHFYDRDGNRAGVVGTFHDITELKHKEEQITYQAHHDELTGLANRLKLKKEVASQIARRFGNSSKLAIIYLDLDNFKDINDSLGHQTGDRLLTHAAERLVSIVGERGMVCRLGGDEFVVLMSSVHDESEAAVMADAILRTFRAPFMVDGHELFVTTSIGITCYPADGEDSDTLIKNADIAMYRAKEQERGSWKRFDISMVEKVERRLAIEKDMRKGLENNEFIPYYQPRVDLETGLVTGMEALVRWVKPDGSIISPAEFIPVAEDTGLIVALGESVLRQACAQTYKWHTSGLKGLRVSVNISAHQFRANLLDVVNAALFDSGLDPSTLELEITETTMMHDLGQSVSLLEEIAKRGISTAIDDFGTGYSSMKYLKTFPINTLKVDRSFVNDVLSDDDDATIVETIIKMAHNLSLRAVAEGVETEEQLDFLRKRNCPEVQGYLFSKPVPAPEFEIYVRKQNKLS